MAMVCRPVSATGGIATVAAEASGFGGAAGPDTRRGGGVTLATDPVCAVA